MSVSGGKNRNRSGPTKATRAQQEELWRAAQSAGGKLPGGVTQAQDTFGLGQQAGRQGLGALTGDPTMQQQFMNPYQSQVMDRLNEQFAVQNQMTTQGINDQATQAGAFGGSRHGVAQGVALGENARNQGMITANMLNQGFEGAMGRAGQVANLGFGSAQAGSELAMQAGNPAIWRLNMLQRGFNPLQSSRGSGWNLSYMGNRGGG